MFLFFFFGRRLQLQTVRGLRLLLQHDDCETAEKWLEQIRRTIHTAVRESERVFSYRRDVCRSWHARQLTPPPLTNHLRQSRLTTGLF